MEPEGSSPPGLWEVHEPLHNWDAARDPRSDLGGEISQLTLFLNAIQTAHIASKWETTNAQVATTDAQARTIDNISFIEKLCPNVHGLV